VENRWQTISEVWLTITDSQQNGFRWLLRYTEQLCSLQIGERWWVAAARCPVGNDDVRDCVDV